MSKIDESKEILKELGLPAAQQNEISAYSLLALRAINPHDNMFNATTPILKNLKFTLTFYHFKL